MMASSAVVKFWTEYLSALPKGHVRRVSATPKTWSFGNDQSTADKLVELVKRGIKTLRVAAILA